MTKILVGPPGTGKTTHLMGVLKDLLTRAKPAEIAAVTFTREGAYQLITRACENFGLRKEDFPYVKTLHSLAFSQLGMVKDKMMDAERFKDFSRAMGMQFVGHCMDGMYANEDDKYLFYAELQRNNPQTLIKHIQEFESDKFEYVKRNYTRFKETFRVYDYTDLIETFVNIGEQVPVRFAIVDEAQDLTTLQWQMVFTAFGHCEELYIAGDDDQAIYQWSGADVNAFLSVKGEQVVLNHSYRLPDNILEFSKKVSARIVNRIPKAYNGKGKLGELQILGDLEQLPKIDVSQSWLFLTRNNGYLKKYEEQLQRLGIPYTVKGAKSITEDDLEIFRLAKKEQESWSDNKTLYISNYVRQFGYDNLDYVNRFRIRINTIHTTKGAEADNVVVLLDITRNVLLNYEADPDSEHRVFYVAFTRAKENLYIVRSTSKYTYPLPGESI